MRRKAHDCPWCGLPMLTNEFRTRARGPRICRFCADELDRVDAEGFYALCEFLELEFLRKG